MTEYVYITNFDTGRDMSFPREDVVSIVPAQPSGSIVTVKGCWPFPGPYRYHAAESAAEVKSPFANMRRGRVLMSRLRGAQVIV